MSEKLSSSASASSDSVAKSSETSRSASASSSGSSGSSSSGSSSLQDGCVSCDNNVSCPKCADDEYCVTTSLSCTQCPRTYCEKRNTGNGSSSSSSGSSPASSSLLASPSSSSSSSSSNKVGPIVGGVVGGVGGVLVLALLAFLYYRYYKRKRSALPADAEYMEKEARGDISGGGSPHHPGMLRSTSTTSSHARARNKRNRSSAATIQTSTASNIIPVAYIPGVTTNLTKKNLRKGPGRGTRKFYQDSDRKSHITLGSSILGDDDDDEDEDDIDNAMANGDRDRDSPGSDGPNLTTAIRARPKLVQIDELAEEDGEEHDQILEKEQQDVGGPDGQLLNIQDTSSIGNAGHSNSVLDVEQQAGQGQGQRQDSRDDIRRDSYNTTASYANSESRDPFHSTMSISSDSNSEGSFILDVEIASNHHHHNNHTNNIH